MKPHEFVYSMMAEVHRRYPREAMIWCLQWSIRTLKDFMKLERIAFGDKKYAWDRAGAIDLVDAFDYQ